MHSHFCCCYFPHTPFLFPYDSSIRQCMFSINFRAFFKFGSSLWYVFLSFEDFRLLLYLVYEAIKWIVERHHTFLSGKMSEYSFYEAKQTDNQKWYITYIQIQTYAHINRGSSTDGRIDSTSINSKLKRNGRRMKEWSNRSSRYLYKNRWCFAFVCASRIRMILLDAMNLNEKNKSE